MFGGIMLLGMMSPTTRTQRLPSGINEAQRKPVTTHIAVASTYVQVKRYGCDPAETNDVPVL
jgi:hypothetical protein